MLIVMAVIPETPLGRSMRIMFKDTLKSFVLFAFFLQKIETDNLHRMSVFIFWEKKKEQKYLKYFRMSFC